MGKTTETITRVALSLIFGAAAMVLIFGTCESLLLNIISKPAGIVTALVCAACYPYDANPRDETEDYYD